MSDSDWQSVDEYVEQTMLGPDQALAGALARNSEAELPPIDVSPAHAAFLGVLVRATRARRVLEVGTLGGYSTIELARALPDDGFVTSIELVPDHAEVARENLVAAGVADRVEVVVGAALDVLDQMLEDPPEPFDFTFIDADKEHSPEYFERAVKLSHPGALIVVDNVVRDGRLVTTGAEDAQAEGNRRLHQWIGEEPDIHASTIQTVGRKGWDGFTIAVAGEGAKRY
jgi:predicted O-methyltransferase YrrM